MRDQRPLADRLRPTRLADFVGQSHLIDPGKPIAEMIQRQRLHSLILWGPPGVGKTTLARIIATSAGRAFHELSAVSAGKAELKAILDGIARGQQRDLFSFAFTDADDNAGASAPVVFLDEIHRFNKAQQDFLLPYVENGTIVLIGATTENPSFEVIPALLSRTRVFVLEALSPQVMRTILARGAALLEATIDDDAYDFLIAMADGDARQAINLLEVTAALNDGVITRPTLANTLQSRHMRYDKKAESHYNTISAFIKSMRASNVDAALHYLARMVSAGEDPKFIARRLVIFASEDIGIADPQALAIANGVFRAVETIGYPECQINLAHGTVYMARAPKSRQSYDAYFAALDDVKAHGDLPIPLKLRNPVTGLMKSLAYGEGYSFYDGEDLLPDALRDRRYFDDAGVTTPDE